MQVLIGYVNIGTNPLITEGNKTKKPSFLREGFFVRRKLY